MGLALVFHNRVVREFFVQLFARSTSFSWALIFLQFFGLHPVTGVLAIALPYAATFALESTVKFLKKVIEVRNGRYRLTAVLSQDSGMFGYLIYGHTCSATLAIALNVACARVRCLASSVCRRLVFT